MSTYYKYHLYKDQCKDAIFEIQVQNGAGARLARARCGRFSVVQSFVHPRQKSRSYTLGSALVVLSSVFVGVALVIFLV